MSGAVTMKMMSSTSITSMYVTTFISDIRRRRLRSRFTLMADPLCPSGMRLALEDGRKFLDEDVVAGVQALDVVRVAVIADDGRNGGEESHGGCHERFRDARCHHRQRRLMYVSECLKGVHDAP